jgi:hypothetical protein
MLRNPQTMAKKNFMREDTEDRILEEIKNKLRMLNLFS